MKRGKLAYFLGFLLVMGMSLVVSGVGYAQPACEQVAGQIRDSDSDGACDRTTDGGTPDKCIAAAGSPDFGSHNVDSNGCTCRQKVSSACSSTYSGAACCSANQCCGRFGAASYSCLDDCVGNVASTGAGAPSGTGSSTGTTATGCSPGSGPTSQDPVLRINANRYTPVDRGRLIAEQDIAIGGGPSGTPIYSNNANSPVELPAGTNPVLIVRRLRIAPENGAAQPIRIYLSKKPCQAGGYWYDVIWGTVIGNIRFGEEDFRFNLGSSLEQGVIHSVYVVIGNEGSNDLSSSTELFFRVGPANTVIVSPPSGSSPTPTTCTPRIEAFDYNFVVGKVGRLKVISNKRGKIIILAKGVSSPSNDYRIMKECGSINDPKTECEYKFLEDSSHQDGQVITSMWSGSLINYYAELQTPSGECVQSTPERACRWPDVNAKIMQIKQAGALGYCTDETHIYNGGADPLGSLCTSSPPNTCNPGYCGRDSGNPVCIYPTNCVSNPDNSMKALRTFLPLCDSVTGTAGPSAPGGTGAWDLCATLTGGIPTAMQPLQGPYTPASSLNMPLRPYLRINGLPGSGDANSESSPIVITKGEQVTVTVASYNGNLPVNLPIRIYIEQKSQDGSWSVISPGSLGYTQPGCWYSNTIPGSATAGWPAGTYRTYLVVGEDVNQRSSSSYVYFKIQTPPGTSACTPVLGGNQYAVDLSRSKYTGCNVQAIQDLSNTITCDQLAPTWSHNNPTGTMTFWWPIIPGATSYNIRLEEFDATTNTATGARIRDSGTAPPIASNCGGDPHYYCVNGITAATPGIIVIGGQLSIDNIRLDRNKKYAFWVDPVSVPGCGTNYVQGSVTFRTTNLVVPRPINPSTATSTCPAASISAELT
ncbi:MAG: hypothetical protein AABX33_05275 [Nanoarchaeota archaeon]